MKKPGAGFRNNAKNASLNRRAERETQMTFRVFRGAFLALGVRLAILGSAVTCAGAHTPELKLTTSAVSTKRIRSGSTPSHPRLSWRISGPYRGIRQTAYQIRVAEYPEACRNGAPLTWDSGRVDSESSVHVPYQGPPTGSGQRRYWQVRFWDAQGQTSAWSSVAFWEMGCCVLPTGRPSGSRQTSTRM